MASIYLDNLPFFRNIVAVASEQLIKQANTPTTSDASRSSNQDSENTSDISGIRICARIRPLIKEEGDENHITGVLAKGKDQAVLFEPRVKFRRAAIPDATRYEFSLDRVYDGTVGTDVIYEESVKELAPWVWSGGISTLFTYGQTGSGKTYTVNGITKQVVQDLMSLSASEEREFHVCCFELLGSKSFDLLNNRRQFSILEDSYGATQLVGIQEERPTSESEFHALFEASALLRTSATTAKNDQSSRSHAVYRIRVIDKSRPELPGGELFLIDLAGSEGSQDSSSHSKERFQETRDINVSLSTLKDCIRGRTQLTYQQMQVPEKRKKVHVPWRSSKLTQVLKHVFGTDERACKTVVVACVAPSFMDWSHSKNTLRYAEMLRVPAPKTRMGNKEDAAGWSNEKIKEWISENSGTPAIDAEILAQNLTGIQLCKLPEEEFIERCLQTEGVTTEQARAFFQKLWRTRIDIRSQSSQPPAMEKNASQEPKPPPPRIPFKDRIVPGMIVRVGPKVWAFNGTDKVMVLSPAEAKDFEGGDERRFICAAVTPGLIPTSYEMHIVSKKIFSVSEFEAEVLMEYDMATRYYFVEL